MQLYIQDANEFVSCLSDIVFNLCSPGGSEGKESACNSGDLGSVPELEEPLEKGMATYFSV